MLFLALRVARTPRLYALPVSRLQYHHTACSASIDLPSSPPHPSMPPFTGAIDAYSPRMNPACRLNRSSVFDASSHHHHRHHGCIIGVLRPPSTCLFFGLAALCCVCLVVVWWCFVLLRSPPPSRSAGFFPDLSILTLADTCANICIIHPQIPMNIETHAGHSGTKTWTPILAQARKAGTLHAVGYRADKNRRHL